MTTSYPPPPTLAGILAGPAFGSVRIDGNVEIGLLPGATDVFTVAPDSAPFTVKPDHDVFTVRPGRSL